MEANEFTVLVPLVAVRTLDKADTTLRQSPRHQALPSKVGGCLLVQSIELFRRFRFLVDLKRLRRFGLHTERQLESLDTPFQLRVVLAREGMPPVLLLNHVQFESLQIG